MVTCAQMLRQRQKYMEYTRKKTAASAQTLRQRQKSMEYAYKKLACCAQMPRQKQISMEYACRKLALCAQIIISIFKSSVIYTVTAAATHLAAPSVLL